MSNERLTHPGYRPDIDGLRAFAVLAVVFYHAFPGELRGGFVGVDVFFVISGYLISTIIFSNLERGTFSFPEFYARRVKRIFPALILTLAACVAFGWYGLLADEYEQLGKHIAGGAGFVSNLVLWSESGYFDNAAEYKPLLHLWSLGIEEQFYIIWPLLVWLAWKSRLGLLGLTAAVFLFSFVLNVYGIDRDAVATFYSPLTRVWELSVGSALAYLTLHRIVDSTKLSSLQANTLSTVGFTLLIVSVFLIHDRLPFPGWWAVIPVLGSALVIAAGSQAFVNSRLLSNKPAVWFGLISFPLYLWHWPLLSFGRIAEGQIPHRLFRVAAVLIAILLAWLTYRYVERRIRYSRGYASAAALLFSCILLGSAGGYIFVNDGVANRAAVRNSGFNEEVSRQFMGPLWPYTKNDLCLKEYPFRGADKLGWWFCMKSSEASPTLIIIGNSVANQLYPGFIHNAALSHHSVLSIGACDPAAAEDYEVDELNPCYGNRANEQVVFIQRLIASEKTIRFAVIDGLSDQADSAYIDRLRKLVSSLQAEGIRVVIFTPHVEPAFHPRACFSTPLRAAKDCSFPAAEREARLQRFKPVMEAFQQTHPDVGFFEQNEIFCDRGRCAYVRDGLPLHRDELHISEYASIELQAYFNEWARKNLPEIFDSAYVGRR